MSAARLSRAVAGAALVGLVACSSGSSASQTAADARRDNVPPKIAALTAADRIQVARSNVAPFRRAAAKATEGMWIASRLHVDLMDNKCTYHVADGDIYYCSTDWGEVLLRGDDGTIKRAFPLPGVPPQYITVAPAAVYCGRQGDGGLPNSMVCRIDRKTRKMIVRVFPSAIDSGTDPKAYRPKSWTLDTREIGVSELTLDEHGLRVDASVHLDPQTLEILV